MTKEKKQGTEEKKNSSGTPACNGCQWQADIHGAWCEMFRYVPENLPCAQHDRYEYLRKERNNRDLAFYSLVMSDFMGLCRE
jgi:hypothetical protein